MKRLILCFATAIIFVGCSVSSFTNAAKPVTARSEDLVFPVAGNKSNIGSYWGDGRDNGKRKHEGIDIFAKKGTEVVAVCSGTVSVSNGGIGGKTIWLQADNYSWSAYYAHLDSQYVYNGQIVNKGDIIGKVGNTGNAKYAPAHLHFGIYTNSGAIDPLPFIKTAPKLAVTVELPEEKAKQPSTLPAKKSTLKKAPSNIKKV